MTLPAADQQTRGIGIRHRPRSLKFPLFRLLPYLGVFFPLSFSFGKAEKGLYKDKDEDGDKHEAEGR